jgi:hypothetical protein
LPVKKVPPWRTLLLLLPAERRVMLFLVKKVPPWRTLLLLIPVEGRLPVERRFLYRASLLAKKVPPWRMFLLLLPVEGRLPMESRLFVQNVVAGEKGAENFAMAKGASIDVTRVRSCG